MSTTTTIAPRVQHGATMATDVVALARVAYSTDADTGIAAERAAAHHKSPRAASRAVSHAPIPVPELLAASDASLTAREVRARNAIRTLLARLDQAERHLGDRADIRLARAYIMALSSDDDRKQAREMAKAISADAHSARVSARNARADTAQESRASRARVADTMAEHRARLGIRDYVDLSDARVVANLIDRRALDMADPAVTCAAIDALIESCVAAYRADRSADQIAYRADGTPIGDTVPATVPWSVWTLGKRWGGRIAVASLFGAGSPDDECPNRHYRSRGSVAADRVRFGTPTTDPGTATMQAGQTNGSHLCASRASAAFGRL